MSERDFQLVIVRKDLVADGVVRLTLMRKDGAELPAWEPGAHIDLRFNSSGVEYVRQYSLCGSVTDKYRWEVAVRLVRDGRGGSAHIHGAFAEGDTVQVTGPRNNFPLMQARHYLFIAGGIGITPILPMIDHAHKSGADWRLLYCGRSVDSMPFTQEILTFGADRIVLHESDSRGDADLPALIAQAHPEAAIYCCGPEPMLRAVEDGGPTWSGDRVHIERFSLREDVSVRTDTEFEVEFARTGVVLTVPVGRSILDVAEENGVDIESSCQEGLCGTCETRVISGTPDHRDSVLSDEERAASQTMMVCVSRSCSARLVLDA